MTITNATLTDIDTIFELYKIASDYQKTKKTVVVWPDFERKMVVSEIKENRQFKLIINNTVACVWAIALKTSKFGKPVKMTMLFTFIVLRLTLNLEDNSLCLKLWLGQRTMQKLTR